MAAVMVRSFTRASRRRASAWGSAPGALAGGVCLEGGYRLSRIVAAGAAGPRKRGLLARAPGLLVIQVAVDLIR